MPDDDLLAGFERAGRPHPMRVFFATTIGASLLVWDLAFTYGAYHTVFYYRLFQIFVVATVMLIGSVLLRRQIRVRPWMRLLLSVPAIWMVVRLSRSFGHDSPAARALDDLLVALTVAGVPFILLALTRVLVPDYFRLPTRRIKVVAVSIVALVAIGGYLTGHFNYRFTTCQAYVVAGDDEPGNCRPAPAASSMR